MKIIKVNEKSESEIEFWNEKWK